MFGNDGYGAIGLCDVSNGGLRSWGKVVDGKANRPEGTPGARVHIRIDGVVDRKKLTCG